MLLTLPHQQGGCEVYGELEGDTARIWAQLTKGIFHTTWHPAQHIKLGRKEDSGECFKLWYLSSQATITCDRALLSLGWLNTCLFMGSSETIPCFALLACTAFSLLIKLSLSQPLSSLIFALLILFPIQKWEEWASGWLVLCCQLDTTQIPESNKISYNWSV